MGNLRGNFYSRRHISLNPDKDPEFWDFSAHEIAIYDYPAIFDYVLNYTKQESVFYSGHSVGSLACFIFTAMKPEYNKKIKIHLALAPAFLKNHDLSLWHKLFINSGLALTEISLSNQIYDIFPRREYFTKVLEMSCADGSPLQPICLNAMMATVGYDYAQLNSSNIPDIVKYYPSGGGSINLLRQTFNLIKTGKFEPYRYKDPAENLKKYNQVVPEPYNISLITHKVSLHYGAGDFLVTSEDIDLTDKVLPRSIGKFLVPFKDFNHLDFLWAKDNKILLYDQIIKIMDKYR